MRLDKLESGGGTVMIKTAVNQLIFVVNQIKLYFGFLWIAVYYIIKYLFNINGGGAIAGAFLQQNAFPNIESYIVDGQFAGFDNLTDAIV